MTGQDTSRSLAAFEATFRQFRERVKAPAARRSAAVGQTPRREAALQLVERVFD